MCLPARFCRRLSPPFFGRAFLPARFQALAGLRLPCLPPPGVGWTSGSWFDPAERAAVEANEKARLDALRADKKLPKV